MPIAFRPPATLLVAALLLAVGGLVPSAAGAKPASDARFATFNASLNRSGEGELVRDLSDRDDAQAQAVAEIIQRQRPDVLLINEFDYDEGGDAARMFQDNYLSVGHNGADPIAYPYRYVAPVNTGVPSGFDLNNDGRVGGPNDALGFGLFPGQYGMLVLSGSPSSATRCAPSASSCGRTCPARCCPTIPRRPSHETSTPRPSSRSCRCRPRATGTCRSASGAGPCTSW